MIPFGEDAVRFDVPASIDARRALLARLRALDGVRDVILCETTGCVVFSRDSGRAAVAEALASPLETLETLDALDAAPAKNCVVPVVYDGEDLDAVAAAIGKSRDDVIALHSDHEYRVSMLGFLPGFAYLRGLPPPLVLPRRAPRPRVPARSVAIGADYTGIYPVASPGGWHLLGRALTLPEWGLGDRVRFVPMKGPLASDTTLPSKPTPKGPHVVVTKVAGLALVVDGGHPGQMHLATPPGGPLVRRAFTSANAACGNAIDAGAIEVTGTIEVETPDGKHFSCASGAERVGYLAVPGGLELRNGPLRRGDVLAIGAARGEASSIAISSVHPDRESIELVPGPDLDDALRAMIATSEFTISSTSNRTGTRLDGPALPARDTARASTPMIEGAIELTPSGLVVLGPDHPTTGGYPVVALLAKASRDRFFAMPFGARARFAFRG